jgi:hypothetical protein
MNQHFILNSIINNNNTICELLLRNEEIENELLMNLIPKKRKPFKIIFVLFMGTIEDNFIIFH